jgi:hypothetical protein
LEIWHLSSCVQARLKSPWKQKRFYKLLDYSLKSVKKKNQNISLMGKYQNISLTGKYQNGSRNNVKTICGLPVFHGILMCSISRHFAWKALIFSPWIIYGESSTNPVICNSCHMACKKKRVWKFNVFLYTVHGHFLFSDLTVPITQRSLIKPLKLTSTRK